MRCCGTGYLSTKCLDIDFILFNNLVVCLLVYQITHDIEQLQMLGVDINIVLLCTTLNPDKGLTAKFSHISFP